MNTKPLILVYVDHPMCSIDCADATCEVLNQSGFYDAKMIGPDSHPYLKFTAENLSIADCLIMPGGDGDADQFDNDLFKYKDMVANYVSEGGRYLGICQGAYFAGQYYFNLLHGYDSKQYIKRKGSTIKRCGPSVVNIKWRGSEDRPVYFHDGAAFIPTESNKFTSADVFARYKNKDAAALIQSYKRGKVGVIGPHPEAMRWWFYTQTKVKEGWKGEMQHDLLLELVEELLD